MDFEKLDAVDDDDEILGCSINIQVNNTLEKTLFKQNHINRKKWKNKKAKPSTLKNDRYEYVN